ncbi:MAG TPA: (Fe-S)-binding protein [Nocardioidaceae bacterium]|nr:(Fe-S)-binding protein [Nocardioidaceae bacterium]
MTVVLVLGLVMNAIALPLAAKRVMFLYKLISSGQPDPGRVENVKNRLPDRIKTQLVEVVGQRKLLKWSIPGAAHAFVMYAFLILGTVYLEAYGILLSTNPDWAIPVVGHWEILGFAQDFIAVMCLAGLATFAIIRVKNAPERMGRQSRFKGSHLGGAWMVLFMIFNVIWTMLLFRGAASAGGNLPYDTGAFASVGIGNVLDGMSHDAIEFLEHAGLLLHIGIMLVFLIIVLNSKHLHIFVAPINVLFKREPVALGAAAPLLVGGQEFNLEMVEDMDEDAVIGIGKIEDFSWKGLLDMATCTECGRCQSQCPAWNTEKPLSPKMLIMNLRDHAFAKAPYMLASEEERENLPDSVKAEAQRELVGATEGEAWHPSGGAVIDPDVLWSCTSCGACVNQCPVDIEHVDHIIDMRRYQVLIESNFPSELNGLFKGLENKGNPWNMNPNERLDWTKGLDFEVKVVGEDIESLDEVEWLFWVGCAGAYEDRAKKTTRAVAELLDMAGVSFAVLGNGETCTGDSARRAGNEFVYQQLAMENIEVFKETKVKKVVSTCAHCFNTLKNEYKQLGIELEVVHHTQLLNRLVREGKLTPVPDSGAPKKTITYHDPCFLGRHNQVYTPPRELLQVIPNAEVIEMERSGEKSFCCGAGGARMWMEETIGERINENRTREAVGTGADAIAVGCPFCRVMLDDGLTKLQADGDAREEVAVLDVAQLLLAGVKRDVVAKAEPAAEATVAAAAGGTATAVAVAEPETEVEAEVAPEPEPTPEPTPEPEPEPVAEAVEAVEPEATEPTAEGDATPETDKLF